MRYPERGKGRESAGGSKPHRGSISERRLRMTHHEVMTSNMTQTCNPHQISGDGNVLKSTSLARSGGSRFGPTGGHCTSPFWSRTVSVSLQGPNCRTVGGQTGPNWTNGGPRHSPLLVQNCLGFTVNSSLVVITESARVSPPKLAHIVSHQAGPHQNYNQVEGGEKDFPVDA